MQLYAVALLAFVGLASAHFLPKSPEKAFHDLEVEQLYETENPNVDPAHTKMVLDRLVENYSLYDTDEEDLTQSEQEDKKLFVLLANLSDVNETKCNEQYFLAIRALIDWFEHGGRSPALSAYVSDIREKQHYACAEKHVFAGFNNYLEEALYLLA